MWGWTRPLDMIDNLQVMRITKQLQVQTPSKLTCLLLVRSLGHRHLRTALGMTSPQGDWPTTLRWPSWLPSCPQTSRITTTATSMATTPHSSQWCTTTTQTLPLPPPPPTTPPLSHGTSKGASLLHPRWFLFLCDRGVILLLMLVRHMLWLGGTCTYKYYAANRLTCRCLMWFVDRFLVTCYSALICSNLISWVVIKYKEVISPFDFNNIQAYLEPLFNILAAWSLNFGTLE